VHGPARFEAVVPYDYELDEIRPSAWRLMRPDALN
jgi:hypothetical protein